MEPVDRTTRADAEGARRPPPGWYDDPGQAGGRRWWDGSGWTEHHHWAPTLEPFPPFLPPAMIPPPERTPRSQRWIAWLAVASFLFLVGLIAAVGAGVRIDQSSGRFGRIPVPGEGYGLAEVGTYVIADGNYAAAMHDAPTFTVTGPNGEDVPVEYTYPRYGSEDNALAVFDVVTPGRYRLQVTDDGESADRMPTNVTVNRDASGPGDNLGSAFAILAAGVFAILLSIVIVIVGIVSAARGSRR